MKSDVYQVITDRIISLLENGVVPWQKSWQSAESSPRNLVTKKDYRGVNVFLLHSMPYESPYWLTFKQANALGGHVRRGEKSCPVVFWKWLEIADPTEPSGKKAMPFLRLYGVFNVAQCDGIPQAKIPSPIVTKREHIPFQESESIVAAMPKRPEIQLGSARACYRPSVDKVEMPNPEAFRSGQDYYSVLFHELTHSTGHESRLNRKGVGGSEGEWSAFGSTPYAKEELVAEMGASFLCGMAGIADRTIENSAAYVNSWLQRIKDDKKLVLIAAAQAQKAADWVLGRQEQKETQPDS